MKLYDLAGADEALRFSPYCWRVRMALRHKQLEFETVPWRFTAKEAIAFSGQQLVPVLVDGEQTLADSWAIARYLERAYPERPSLFGGDAAAAAALFVKHWSEQVVHPALLSIVLLDIHAVLNDQDQEYFRRTREQRLGMTLEAFAQPDERGVSTLRNALAPLRATLVRQPFLGGAAPLFVDYIVFGAFMWARTVSRIALLESDDPVSAWQERLLDAFGGYARGARRVAEATPSG